MDNISDLRGLQDDLAGLPGKIVRECFPDALAAGGAVMEDAVRRRTPKAPKETTSAKRYGSLVDDLATSMAVNEQQLSGSAKTGFSDDGFPARFVEFGHNTSGGFTPAQPFIRPAAEESTEAAADAFVESLAENMEKI
ncbi:MAG TPA: HK97-gp10 family putative phage morphogenesis protein [Bryobacteraceae bacterium]|jgi:HK97 gp10 family phage protein|nr:HK97-gp10 family putative phage morphogenesis protein [Bryobacteraceae bacterium]